MQGNAVLAGTSRILGLIYVYSFILLSFAMYRSISFELKCAVNSVALKLMLAPFISYSLLAVLACQHGVVNRMGHMTAGDREL